MHFNSGSGPIILGSDSILLFHYVPDSETARLIRESRELKPSYQDEGVLPFKVDPMYVLPHVNITDARPEEGKAAISMATALDEHKINYGLELIIQRKGLVQAKDHLPRSYQIYGPNPIPVKVVGVRRMDKLQRLSILRFFGQSGVTHSIYVPRSPVSY